MRITLLLLLIGFTTKAQELTCEDFQSGKFYIPQTDEMTNYKLVSNDTTVNFKLTRDTTISKYVVIREENTQIEWQNGIGNGKPAYETIEWLDDCTYRLKYDPTKENLSSDQKWVNDNNGLVITKKRIQGNCMYYTATITTNAGEKISQEGIICKE